MLQLFIIKKLATYACFNFWVAKIKNSRKSDELYFDYDEVEEVVVEEFLIEVYKASEIVVAYNIKSKRFKGVYGDAKFWER